MEPRQPAEVIAERLKAIRTRRGLSVAKLAAKCAQLGMPKLNRDVITNIEIPGRRQDVGITELLGLAYALDVPPMSLLLPGTGERVSVTPSASMDVIQLLTWVSGELPPADAKLQPDRLRRWLEIAGPLSTYRALRTDMQRVEMLEVIARTEPDRRPELEGALADVATLVNSLMDSGATPPALPERWLAEMTAHGLLKHPELVPVLGGEQS